LIALDNKTASPISEAVLLSGYFSVKDIFKAYSGFQLIFLLKFLLLIGTYFRINIIEFM